MRSNIVTPVFLSVVFSIQAWSQAPKEPTAQAIATISFNTTVLQTTESQRDLNALQVKFAPRQAHLESLNREVELLRSQLSSKSASGSDADRSAKEQSLNSKERQLQREAEDFKNDSDGASQQAFQTVAQKVYAFVQTYAQKHGYTLVLERGSDTAPVVWYAGKDIDITDQVVKAYNQTEVSSPAQGSSAPASNLPSSPAPHSGTPCQHCLTPSFN